MYTVAFNSLDCYKMLEKSNYTTKKNLAISSFQNLKTNKHSPNVSCKLLKSTGHFSKTKNIALIKLFLRFIKFNLNIPKCIDRKN